MPFFLSVVWVFWLVLFGAAIIPLWCAMLPMQPCCTTTSHSTMSLLILDWPHYCISTASVLHQYCISTASVLHQYCIITAITIPIYQHCNMPTYWYTTDTLLIHYWYTTDTLLIHYWYTTVTLLTPVLLQYWYSTAPSIETVLNHLPGNWHPELFFLALIFCVCT